jgi:hypothetical protein
MDNDDAAAAAGRYSSKDQTAALFFLRSSFIALFPHCVSVGAPIVVDGVERGKKRE